MDYIYTMYAIVIGLIIVSLIVYYIWNRIKTNKK